ncbi:MAG: glycosyltransferase [Kastovskya adunca ATA6-11-RM4]|jgi:GT2 family glycosyltransferase|nr:glycosyltransferase [Kastovskya adunca ATA6-11-RM4]
MTGLLNSTAKAIPDTTTIVKLQNLALPRSGTCTVDKLFFRGNRKSFFNYQNNKLEFYKGEVVSFSTYFNLFSVSKWKKYTTIKSLGVALNLKGKFKVKLLNKTNFSQSVKLVDQKVISFKEETLENIITNIDISSYEGLLYVEIEVLEDDCQLSGGYFYAPTNLPETELLKFAIVICTYKRELYIEKNIHLIENYLLNNSDVAANFEIFIIDNGRTLKKFSNSKIHLIRNKNAGGSGGYTRGLIEVLNKKNEFSHIIFMDDDVVVDPEVFQRFYYFLRASSDQSLCVGGSMLKLDTQYIQQENGAIWNSGVVSLKANLDLRSLENVLINEIEEYINYNGWWLFCFPLSTVDEFNLPYPFFIKMDDMEFPMRLKQKITTLNGICVWHEPLESKYSPSLNYYFRRNELILGSLYPEVFSKTDAVKHLVKLSLREALCYRYKSAQLALKAASDFLQGPDYLKNTNPEEKNLEILKMGEKAVKNPDMPFIYGKYSDSIHESENSIHRLFRLITLNGHLLPSFFFYSDQRLVEKGYKIAPIQGYRPINAFRAKKVLYYNLSTQEGFVVQLARGEFFKILKNIVVLAFILLFKFPTISSLYRQTLPELTNKAFWENYLEVDKYSNQKNV